jgi:hypothetical protein
MYRLSYPRQFSLFIIGLWDGRVGKRSSVLQCRLEEEEEDEHHKWFTT